MKVSIITACHNKGAFIKAAYKSLLSQTFLNWEWVIVDDSSTDSSLRQIRRFCRADARVRVITPKKRLWCAGAYALAASHCNGLIVGVLDADDVLVPKSIDRVVKLYNRYPEVGYIYTQHEICDKSMKLIKTGVSSLPSPGKSFIDMTLEGQHCFSHWRTYRNGIIDPYYLFPMGLQSCVDKYMGFTLEKTTIGGFHNKVLYKYRWYSGGNISSLVNKRKDDTQRIRWKSMAEDFRKKGEKTFPVLELI